MLVYYWIKKKQNWDKNRVLCKKKKHREMLKVPGIFDLWILQC